MKISTWKYPHSDSRERVYLFIKAVNIFTEKRVKALRLKHRP